MICAMMTIVLLLSIRIASATTNAGSIAGVISDTSGGRIAGARIALRSAARRYDAISDRQGAFALADIEPGVYGIDATAAGFSPVTARQITVLAGTPTDVVLVLARATASGVASLGSVIVNGTSALSRSSAPTVEINPQALAEKGVAQLSDILGQQIAVTMVRNGGGAPGMPQSAALRGPDPEETMVDIDGHQVNNQNTGDYTLELLDPAEFAGVQIVYGVGPSSLTGANSEGGAINFRTIEPTRESQGLVRFSFGTFDTAGETIEATGTDERIGYAMLYRRFTTQGEVYDYPITIATPGPGTPAQIAVVGSSLTGTVTLAKLRYSLAGGAGFIEASFRDTAAIRDLSAPLSAPDNPSDYAPDAPFTQTNAPGAAARDSAPAYGLDIQLPLGRSAEGIAPAVLTLRHLTNISNQSVENIDPELNPYLVNGSDRVDDDIAQFDRAVPGRSGDDLTIVADYRREQLTAPDVFAPGPPMQDAITRWIVARYAWNPSQYLHYTAAAYYSAFSTFGTSFDPRFAIVWTPPESVVRASVGTGVQPPLLSQLAFNPALQAERSVSEDIGIEHRFGAGRYATRAELSMYNTLVDNPIVETEAADGSLTFLGNVSQSIYRGGEVRADQAISPSASVHATWGVGSAYQLADPSTINPAAPPAIPGQQSQGIPLHKAELSLERQAPPLGLSYSIVATYESGSNELNSGQYVLVDANVGMTFGHTDVSLRGANLTDVFDHKFTLVGAGVPYPIPGGTSPTDAYALQGRSVGVTVTQRF